MMSRMRLIDGVTRVALSASEKGDAAAGGSGGGSTGGGGDCRHGSPHFPQFSMIVYFSQRPTASATSSSPTTTPAAQTTSTGAKP
jgi:hypothetical protein